MEEKMSKCERCKKEFTPVFKECWISFADFKKKFYQENCTICQINIFSEMGVIDRKVRTFLFENLEDVETAFGEIMNSIAAHSERVIKSNERIKKLEEKYAEFKPFLPGPTISKFLK